MRQSLLRPQLLLGCERELIFASGMLTMMVAFSMGPSLLLVFPIGVWIICLAVLQRMAKHDPQMSRVYVRHVNKKIYYPAAAHFTAKEPEPKKHQ